MKHLGQWVLIYMLTAFLPTSILYAQSVIVLDSCGQSYIDPQDANPGNPSNYDTLTYTTYFDTDTLVRSYYVDINAFGGLQVDRTRIFAVMPDESLKQIGGIAFGNCVDCVDGFALIIDDSLYVDQIADPNLIDPWLLTFGQPSFTLTGNLQTLTGVGRVSGRIPVCAIGLQIEYRVFSDPANTATEFSTHVLCPATVGTCVMETDFLIDCGQDSIHLLSTVPADCFVETPQITWSNAAGWSSNLANPSLQLTGNQGMFYFTIQDDCCTFVDSFLVESPIEVDAGPDIIACQGDTLAWFGDGGVTGFWEYPDGSTLDGIVGILRDMTPEMNGAYVFHGFNEEGCEDTDTLLVEVRVPATPIVDYGNPCVGDSVVFTLLNDTLFNAINWFNPDNEPISSPIIPSLTTEDFGFYRVETIDSTECLTLEWMFLLGSTPTPYEAFFDEVCDSTLVFLYPDTLQYEWAVGAEGPFFGTPDGGLFEVSVTNSAGCTTVDIIDIPPPNGPIQDIDIFQPICPADPGEIEITVIDPDRDHIYSIDGGENFFVTPDFDDLQPGNYTVVVVDDLGCRKEVPVEIIQPGPLFVYLSLDSLEVRPTTPVQISAFTVGDVVTYQWIPDIIDSGTAQTNFLASTNMDVRIVVQDSRGCLASDGFPLTIVLGDIYVPNAFSPNDDGVNDKFTFFSDNGSGELIETLQVYDRYGDQMFDATEIPISTPYYGWDGTARGKPMNPGVYTYYGIVRFGNGFRKLFKGDVTLVR